MKKTAEYSFDMLSELEPAYAMTVHKSQGSEYRAVVLCLCGGPQMLLTRSVLYTAITRARELLIIVGNEDVVAAMTRNDRRQRRYSGLKLRLEGKGVTHEAACVAAGAAVPAEVRDLRKAAGEAGGLCPALPRLASGV